ncbi:MAG: YfhO family protein [Lachnospiraceae bacterium]
MKRIHLKDWQKLYLLGFLIPFSILTVLYAANGVYPFGTNCILHIDMYHQYEPFFTELMDKLKNGGSLFYSFRIGLGSDFLSLFAYYLASPVNLLLVFWPADFVIEFMTLIILLKIGLCGMSFTMLLRYRFQNVHYGMAVFGAFYALSSYLAAYSWNIMWLDCILLAPVILLGLERLVREKKPVMYSILLAVSIFSNFYISIMICIFLVFYFFIFLLEENRGLRERLHSFWLFFLYSLLAGGMGAVLLIPEAIILSYSGSSDLSLPDKAENYFSLVNELARHFFGVETYTGRDHWPNLYSGSAIILLLFLYLFNNRISWKYKITRILFMVFFWFSFSNNFLDFFWHGFHFPDSLPGRQSFLYIMLMLLIAYDCFRNLEGISRNRFYLSAGLSFLAIAIVSFFSDSGQLTNELVILTAIFVLSYCILLGLLIFAKKEYQRPILMLLLFITFTELIANFALTGISVTSRTAYTKNWESYQSLLSQVDEQEDTFYRVEETERLTKNDAAIYGYRSATIFSSLMDIGISEFYRKVGMEGGKNFYSYSGATPLTSALLSVKYLLSDSPYEEGPLRTLLYTDGTNYLYENIYTLPLGFTVDPKVVSGMMEETSDDIGNLNLMTSLLEANAPLFTKLRDDLVTIETDQTVIHVEEDGYFYAVYEDKSATTIKVSVGDRSRTFTKTDHVYILDLGWCSAGEDITITNTSNTENFKVVPYALNMQSVSEAFATLNSQTLENLIVTDTRITGSITADSDTELVLSIPSQSGWTVKVDGAVTEVGTFMGSMISIPVTQGTHDIELYYETPGLKLGLMISSLSFGILLFLILAGKVFKKRRKA